MGNFMYYCVHCKKFSVHFVSDYWFNAASEKKGQLITCVNCGFQSVRMLGSGKKTYKEYKRWHKMNRN